MASDSEEEPETGHEEDQHSQANHEGNSLFYF